uniref:(California timema) hypothetical protein n=1 Tax=Timema californicum TaxID=61474 RepID=A0A7R9P524_TIMCA|nr:unnamed protein product [Timema californicum]
MDCETLISEVHSRIPLWQMTNPQHHNRGVLDKLWDERKSCPVNLCFRLDGEEVRLMLWDTAGQEEFDAITKAYYRGAQACVLAFSTTDRDSFEAAHSWKMKVTGYCEDHILSECGPARQLDHTVLDHAATETEAVELNTTIGLANYATEVEDECGEIPTVLVQNKIDLLDQSVVDPEEADLLARALGCRLLRTSVKEDVNVNAVFHHLAARCLAELHEQEEEYSMAGNGLHPYTISAFSPSHHSNKSYHGNGTIVLRPGKQKGHKKKKNVLRNACRIL